MSGTELATYYLSIAASTAGFANDVKKALGELPKMGDDTGKKTGTSIGSAIGKALSTGAKVLATGAIASVGVVVGTAITNGLKRSINIEQARAKLTGLKMDADAVMASALAAVKGTAYGLGDAASVAASMAAAGVKSGEDLTRTLTTVADVAAISGRSLTDIGLIFGSVAARGKLQGDDMLQLMSSGIPVLQLLSQQLGVSSADVSAMVSKGQIDFATFQAAMEAGMGGAALKTGETFTGALNNIKAALGRLGEVVMTPALGGLKAIFQSSIPFVDAFTSRIKPLVAVVVEKAQPALDKVTGWLADFTNSLSNNVGPGWLGALANSALAVASAFNPFEAVIGSILRVLPSVLPLVNNVVSGFAGFAGQLSSGLAPVLDLLVTQLVPSLLHNLGVLFASLASNPALVEAVTTAFTSLGGLFQRLMPDIMVLLAIVADLGSTLIRTGAGLASDLLPVLTSVMESVLPPLLEALKWVAGLLHDHPGLVTAAIGAWAGFKTVQGSISAVKDTISGVKGAITTVTGAFNTAKQAALTVASGAQTAFAAVKSGFETVALKGMYAWGAIKNGASAAAGGIKQAAAALAGWVKQAALAVAQGAKVVASWIAQKAAAIAHGVALAAQKIALGISTAAQWLFNAAMSANPLTLIVIAITAVVAALVWFFTQTEIGQQIWQGFVSFLGNAWQWIKDTAVAVWTGIAEFFTGLWQGIKDTSASVWQAISSFFTTVWDGIKGLAQGLWDFLLKVFSWTPIGFIIEHWGAIRDFLAGLWDTICSVARSAWDGLVGWVKAIPQRVLDALSAIGNLWSRFAEWIGQVKDAAVNKFTGLVDWVRGLPGRILDALGNIGSLLVNAGTNLIQGLWNGISNATAWIKSKISGFMSDVVASIKAFFGIHSPSVLFRDEIGLNLGAGLVEGLARSEDDAHKAATSLAAAALPDVPSIGLPQLARPVSARVSPASAAGTSGGSDVMQVLNLILAAILSGHVIAVDGHELAVVQRRNSAVELQNAADLTLRGVTLV